jgi:hypothetical protein
MSCKLRKKELAKRPPCRVCRVALRKLGACCTAGCLVFLPVVFLSASFQPTNHRFSPVWHSGLSCHNQARALVAATVLASNHLEFILHWPAANNGRLVGSLHCTRPDASSLPDRECSPLRARHLCRFMAGFALICCVFCLPLWLCMAKFATIPTFQHAASALQAMMRDARARGVLRIRLAFSNLPFDLNVSVRVHFVAGFAICTAPLQRGACTCRRTGTEMQFEATSS